MANITQIGRNGVGRSLFYLCEIIFIGTNQIQHEFYHLILSFEISAGKWKTYQYVGKAKILKNRVRQYFQNPEKHPPKVAAMVSKIDTFEYILTDSELEALVLECNLIKKYRPYYNILLKDDKNYPYVKVTNEDYPRLKLSRRMEKDGAKYFGPYQSAAMVREAIDFAQKMFKIPSCDIKLPRDLGKKRACINAQIDKCCAPCENVISKEDYIKRIDAACEFLDGNTKNLTKTLEEEMIKASSNLEFEKAASIRDKINALRQIENKQKIVSEIVKIVIPQTFTGFCHILL